MKIEPYVYDEDSEESCRTYSEIESWNEEFFPPPNHLPKLGVIVRDDNGKALCFLCADMSNSIPRAYIDFLMTNPSVMPRVRFSAVVMAEEFIIDRLRNMGYTHVIAITRHAAMATIARRLGYEIDTTPAFQLSKYIY